MSYNLKYEPSHALRNENLFIEEFYTGADTQIYINNEKCDFISSISFGVQEQLNPLYGYASYTFDDIAIGNRVVIGSINIPLNNYESKLINFTTSDYEEYRANLFSDEYDWDGNRKEYGKEPLYGHAPILDDFGYPRDEAVPIWLAHSDTKVVNIDEEFINNLNDDFNSNNLIIGNNKTNRNVDEEIGYLQNLEQSDRKPLFQLNGDTTYFDTYYSDNSVKHNMLRKNIRNNYIDISIVVNGKKRRTIKTVVFRGSDVAINSNDEAIYEVFQFVARDIIDHDLIKNY